MTTHSQTPYQPAMTTHSLPPNLQASMTSEGYAQIYQAVLVRTGLPHGKVYEAVEAVHEELFGHGCKDTPEAAKHCYLRHHPTRQHKA